MDVFETDGMVELCAVIIDGSLERSVDVVISTQPGTAEGNNMLQKIVCLFFSDTNGQ